MIHSKPTHIDAVVVFALAASTDAEIEGLCNMVREELERAAREIAASVPAVRFNGIVVTE